jgi:Asp/Glu/hydantoin racemase
VRILVLNPNMTEAVTILMTDAGRVAAAPGTTLVPITAPRGLPYLSSRAEAQIGGAIVLELLAEAAGSFDAAIVAAFGDPGLWAARELFDFPVVGISEAAMLTACMLGQRFAIVTFMAAMRGWYRDLASWDATPAASRWRRRPGRLLPSRNSAAISWSSSRERRRASRTPTC